MVENRSLFRDYIMSQNTLELSVELTHSSSGKIDGRQWFRFTVGDDFNSLDIVTCFCSLVALFCVPPFKVSWIKFDGVRPYSTWSVLFCLNCLNFLVLESWSDAMQGVSCVSVSLDMNVNVNSLSDRPRPRRLCSVCAMFYKKKNTV